jgi:hypothetical protein
MSGTPVLSGNVESLLLGGRNCYFSAGSRNHLSLVEVYLLSLLEPAIVLDVMARWKRHVTPYSCHHKVVR